MKFQVLYPDNPWHYTFSRSNSRKIKYRTEKVETMCSWPVQEITADDALCFMWATWPKLLDALRVMEAWGFEYKTDAFVWRKLTSTGKEQFNYGHYTRGCTEVVLLGKRGKGVPILNKSVRQLVSAPLEDHSRKPAEVRSRIAQLVGQDVTKIELFARKGGSLHNDPIHAGFLGTGDEYDGRLITDAIDYYKEL
jgi:site-specific DNA-methyltransferase (adenine-specific)